GVSLAAILGRAADDAVSRRSIEPFALLRHFRRAPRLWLRAARFHSRRNGTPGRGVGQVFSVFENAQIVGRDQHGGSRAQAHHFPKFLVGLRSLRELVPPYIVKHRSALGVGDVPLTTSPISRYTTQSARSCFRSGRPRRLAV